MWNSFGGFFLVFIAGALWIGVGVSVSKCSEKKLNYNIVQGLAYLGSAFFCAILLAGKSLAHGTSGISWFGFVMCMLAGIANFFNYVLTGKAMQKGPNGLVWGIMQAGMIGSFLMGVTFFGEKPDFLRLTGLLLIVCGVLGMGLNKGGKSSSSPQDKSWVLLSLGAMVLVMVTHCCSTLPSFFPDLGKNDTVSRTLGMYLGGVTGFVLTTLPGMIRKRDYGRKGEWINAGILMVLNTSASLFFFYRGLDLLVKIGRAGLAYPLAIGVCVIGFSLYSLFVLKEKFARIALAGLGAVCAGIIMIAIR